MRKYVLLDLDTWKRLTILKTMKGFKTISDAVKYLLDKHTDI